MIYKSLLSCSNNTRELGGFRTAYGGITKNNVYWRSDVPEDPTDADIERLISADITTIIDMRTDAERQKTANALADMAEFEYHHFPITEGSGVPESLEAVPMSYISIAIAENMTKVMKVIVEAEKGVLFHCTAGKDRTGVVSAMILMTCGVDREHIVRDYVISREYNHKRLEAFLAAHPEVDRNIVLANEKSMIGFIELFTERFGTAERYFESIGLSVEHADMIKNKLMKGI